MAPAFFSASCWSEGSQGVSARRAPSVASRTCRKTAFASPTRPTSAGTPFPISDPSMSICTTFTSGEKRGGAPKWKIQLKRAPARITRSAFWSA